MAIHRAFLPVFACLLPVSAEAGLDFCNNTDQTVSIAIGYNDSGTWTSEGWWNADPGECTTAVSGDLTRRYYYWRATSRDYSWENSRYMFCTTSEPFTIRDDENCEARGYERHPFNEIDVNGSTSFKMTLNASGSGATDAPASDEPEYDEPAAGDPGFGPEPGTYGEPYTITGILSHCDWYDAGLGCTVLSDGWSYVATSYDHTDTDLLVGLDEMGVNVPITISGDMITWEGTEALVTISTYSGGNSDAYAPFRAEMQGFWTSTDDPSYQVLIHGSTFEEYSQQFPQGPLAMHFRNGCPGAPGEGPAFELADRLGTEDRCVFVEGVANGMMDLFVAGTMRPLTFRREN